MENLIFLLSVDYTWILSCRGRRHRRPAKNHKITFRLSYFSLTKSTKSQQGGLAPSSFQTTGGVHELVAGSSAWRVRAAKDKVKIGSLASPRNLILPRVRTYHTKKPSRFVHALPARPLKVRELTDLRSKLGRRRRDRVSGRGFGKCADGSNYKPSPVGN